METKAYQPRDTKIRKGKLNILISNCSFHNFGDVLMLYSLDTLLRDSGIKYQLFVDVRDFIDKTSKLQLRIKRIFINHEGKRSRSRKKTLVSELSGYFKMRIFGNEHIDLVFDLNGYFLSDNWGYDHAFRYLMKYSYLHEKGAKIILFPKSFGPFENGKMRGLTQHLISFVDLIYARDPLSFEYLQALSTNNDRIKLASDYTSVVEPIYKPEFDKYRNFAALVVNYRMIDKTNSDLEKYASYISKAVRCIKNLGLNYFVLLHDTKSDPQFVQYLLDREIISCDVITHQDPRVLKGIAASSKIVFSSRYHGILNALNTKTPVIGTAWTHKYNFIAKTYNIAEYIVDVSISYEDLYKIVKRALSATNVEILEREQIIAGLKVMGKTIMKESLALLNDNSTS